LKEEFDKNGLSKVYMQKIQRMIDPPKNEQVGKHSTA